MRSSPLVVGSWICVNLERVVAEEEETDLEHCKKNADGTKGSVGWCDARDLLREIHGFDGRVQQGDGTFPVLRLLRLGFHDRDLR